MKSYMVILNTHSPTSVMVSRDQNMILLVVMQSIVTQSIYNYPELLAAFGVVHDQDAIKNRNSSASQLRVASAVVIT